MSVLFVSRHEGAHQWLSAQIDSGQMPPADVVHLEHLDLARVQVGDTVLGTLPIALAAKVRERGARFVNLDLTVPPELRGKELSAAEMRACGATLTEYEVSKGRAMRIAGAAMPARPPPVATTTVMLASGEAAPQLIGWHQMRTQHVQIVVTQKAKLERASHRLIRALSTRLVAENVKTVEQDFVTKRAWLDWAIPWLESLTNGGRDRVHVNCTGGTKLMAMAMDEAVWRCAAVGLPVTGYYVNTEAGLIDHLGAAASSDLRAGLDLEGVLACQGMSIESAYSAAKLFSREVQRLELAQLLLLLPDRLIGELAGVLGRVEMAARRKDFDGTGTISISSDLQQQLMGPLGLAMLQAGCLSQPPETADHNQLKLSFPYPRGRARDEIDYLRGRWLEAWVGHILTESGVMDWAAGVNVKDMDGVPNELDAIATSGNQLLVMEVKTSNQTRFEGEGSDRNRVAQQGIYKASAIGEKIARVFAERWYVTLRRPDAADLERAASLRLKVFVLDSPKGIDQFKAALASWVQRTWCEPIAGYRRTRIRPA